MVSLIRPPKIEKFLCDWFFLTHSIHFYYEFEFYMITAFFWLSSLSYKRPPHTTLGRKNIRTITVFRCKTAFFDWSWHIVIVPPRPWASRSTLALIRALKWDTVCLWTPTGSKVTSRQIWSIEKNDRFSTKMDVFFDRSTLTACIFGTSGSSETYCTPF